MEWSSNTRNSKSSMFRNLPTWNPFILQFLFIHSDIAGKTNLKPGYFRMQKIIDHWSPHDPLSNLHSCFSRLDVWSTYLMPWCGKHDWMFGLKYSIWQPPCLAPKLIAPVLEPPKFPPKFGVGHWLQTTNSYVDLWTLAFVSQFWRKTLRKYLLKISSAFFPKVMFLLFFPKSCDSRTHVFFGGNMCRKSFKKGWVYPP